MGMVKYIATNTFKKIFKNIASEIDAPVTSVQVGICFAGGRHQFEAYKDFKKVKEIELEDYIGSVIDLSGGVAILEATIAQSGPIYAKEIGCQLDEVKVILRHSEKGLPDAVLLRGTSKIRNIDIEKEFLNS